MSAKYIPAKEVAALIRTDLKKAFPGVKFSVVTRDSSAINVKWVDGPSAAQVDNLIKWYAGGHFNGMEDIMEYHTSTLNGETVRFGADFVFTSRSYSHDVCQTIADKINKEYDFEVIVKDSDYFGSRLELVKWDHSNEYWMGKEWSSWTAFPEVAEVVAPVVVEEPAEEIAQVAEVVTVEETIVAEIEAEILKITEETAQAEQPAPAPLNSYEARIKAKRQRYEERARRANEESNRLYASARSAASVIPFGQPILVGHHSEQRDRNYRARIHDTYGRAFKEMDKAKHYEEKAATVGTGGINSDDPEAIAKLQQQLDEAQALQDRMKAANAAIRKHAKAGQDSQIAALVTLGISEAVAHKLLKPDFASRVGYADYQLTNNSANIRRIAARIEELKAEAAQPDFKIDTGIAGVEVYEEDNRICITFPGKPAEDVRKALKDRAFMWAPSRRAWVRKANANGRYAAREAIKAIAPMM